MNFKNISICLSLLLSLTVANAYATQSNNSDTKQIQSSDLVDQDSSDATSNAGDEDVNAADKKVAGKTAASTSKK